MWSDHKRRNPETGLFCFEHLNNMEKYYYGKGQYSIVSGNGKDLFYIVCHNYKHFNFRYYSLNEDEIEEEQQPRLYSDNETIQLSFRLKNVNNGVYQIKLFSVSQENGNVQNDWRKLDYYNDLCGKGN